MTKYVSQCFIKIGGAKVSEAFMDAVEEVVVDTSLQLPDMFTIRLHDPEVKWVDDESLLDVGKQVEISAETHDLDYGQMVRGTLIKGEITSLEPNFSSAGLTTMMVRGYDKSHRLHRGRSTKSFLKVKDSSIATEIAGDAGLSADVDLTSVEHEWVMQNNQTNMEFLMSRAERIGYQVLYTDDKLYFKKGDFTLGAGPELAYLEDLFSFQPCWTSSHQSDKMIVQSWDPKAKQVIKAEKTPASSLNQGGMKETGGDMAKSAFSSAEEIVVDVPLYVPGEATAMADGLSTDISREFVQAEGICDGNPEVKAGWKITIKGVGKRFSGTYLVTSATHVYTADKYETRFSITGRQPNTLSFLLNRGNGHGAGHGSMQGVVPAVVTNIQDPDDLGRVKVKYPWLSEQDESDWTRIASLMAGPQRGIYYLPEVDDEVLVAFEHGDIHRPYIVGALWNSKDKPPAAKDQALDGGKVAQRVIKTRSGHEIILDDKSGSEQIIIRDKTGNNEMVIDSASNSMSINVDGDFTVTAKGKITLQSTQDLTLDSKAKGSIKTAQDLSLEAMANGKFKGMQLSLEGTSKSELKGLQVAVQATAKCDISGNAGVSVKSPAMTEIQGSLVKIN
jgi:phage protein D/phage baseplate assembly protein gpV